MSSSYYSTQQRISAWILIFNYLFSLILLTIPVSVRANQSAGEEPKNYVLYQKTEAQSWLQIQQQLAPNTDSLEQDQQRLADKYDLTLNEWLLLPDSGTQTLHYPAVQLVFIS